MDPMGINLPTTTNPKRIRFEGIVFWSPRRAHFVMLATFPASFCWVQKYKIKVDGTDTKR